MGGWFLFIKVTLLVISMLDYTKGFGYTELVSIDA
jgi:hypothetical protein